MVAPKSETELSKRIFNLHVVEGKTVGEVAKILQVTHQRITQITQDPRFLELRDHYITNFREALDLKSRLQLLRARQIMVDAAVDAATDLVSAAKDRDPSVRASAIRAQEKILQNIGALQSEGDVGDTKILQFIISKESADALREKGYDPEAIRDFEEETHAGKVGSLMGKGVARLQKIAEEQESSD